MDTVERSRRHRGNIYTFTATAFKGTRDMKRKEHKELGLIILPIDKSEISDDFVPISYVHS